jgi:hypothetical protein
VEGVCRERRPQAGGGADLPARGVAGSGRALILSADTTHFCTLNRRHTRLDLPSSRSPRCRRLAGTGAPPPSSAWRRSCTVYSIFAYDLVNAGFKRAKPIAITDVRDRARSARTERGAGAVARTHVISVLAAEALTAPLEGSQCLLRSIVQSASPVRASCRSRHARKRSVWHE